MTHALVTFLGERAYEESCYELPSSLGNVSVVTQFLGLELAKQKKTDLIVVLGTSGSCWHLLPDWIGEKIDPKLVRDLKIAANSGDVTEEQLQEFANSIKSKIKSRMNMDVDFRIIRDGLDEDNQVNILNTLDEAVGDCNRVSLDITHSFRHLPVLSLLGVMYLEKIKGVEVESVYYGRVDDLYSKKIPKPGHVYDLKGLLTMNDGLTALNVFDYSGDYSAFSELYKQEKSLKQAFFMENTFQPIPAMKEIKKILKNLEPRQHIGSMFSSFLQKRLKERLKRGQRDPGLSQRLYNLAHIYLDKKDYFLATIFFEEAFIAKFCAIGRFMHPDYYSRNSDIAKVVWANFQFCHDRKYDNERKLDVIIKGRRDRKLEENKDRGLEDISRASVKTADGKEIGDNNNDSTVSIILNNFYESITGQNESGIEPGPLVRYMDRHCRNFGELKGYRNRMAHCEILGADENDYRERLAELSTNLFPEWNPIAPAGQGGRTLNEEIAPAGQDGRTLISFLGNPRNIDGYKKVKYRFPGGGDSAPVRFMGSEIAKRIEADRFVVLGTSGSSWHLLPAFIGGEGSDIEKSVTPKLKQSIEAAAGKEKVTDVQLQALANSVKGKIRNEMRMDVDFKIIPVGLDESEQIKIVEIIDQAVGNRNTINLDITYSFRHLPVLALLGGMFLEKAKDNVRMGSVYYCNISPDLKSWRERLLLKARRWIANLGISLPRRQNQKLRGQVYEFSNLLKINQWIAALSIFKRTGDYSVFSDLLPKEQGSDLLKQAFFEERTSQIDSAEETIEKVLQSLEKEPLKGIEALFQEPLKKRLNWTWIDGETKYTKLASIYLEKRDYIRAALYVEQALSSQKGVNCDLARRLRNTLIHGPASGNQEAGAIVKAGEDTLKEELYGLISIGNVKNSV